MIHNLKGKALLLAAIQGFADWIWMLSRSEVRMEVELERTSDALEQADRNYAASEKSMEDAIRRKDKINEEFIRTNKELEQALALDFGDVAVPEYILRMLQCGETDAACVRAAGDPPGRR